MAKVGVIDFREEPCEHVDTGKHKVRPLTSDNILKPRVKVILIICSIDQVGPRYVTLLIARANAQRLYPVVLCPGLNDNMTVTSELFKAGAIDCCSRPEQGKELIRNALLRRKKDKKR